jgi:tRNA threonylcarbamoyladenosine modification (KEOPS) complex Cgi121 subunit
MDIRIHGCRGSIRDGEAFIAALQAYAVAHDIACQAFDADAIYGEVHARSAVEHAVRSISRNTATCNDLSMEILLYASGCRQIRNAIERAGIRNGPVVLVAVGDTAIEGVGGRAADIDGFLEEHSLVVDDDVLAGSDSVLERFDISMAMREAIDTSMYEDLILEQVAMVDLHT